MSIGHILYLYETAVGLGHQRRASGVVNGLIERGFQVTVASGTFVEPEQYFDARAHLVRLPANRTQKPDGQYYYYDHDNVLQHDPEFNLASWKQARVEAARELAQTSQIDAIIGEWWPFQRRKEFNDVIAMVMREQTERYGRPLLLASARDILTKFEGADDAKANEAAEAALRIINNQVDHVMIHGDPTLVSLQDTFYRHAEITKPISYTGYVVNDGARDTELGGKREDTVIISCGSGDNGHNLLKAAFRARLQSQLKHHEWIYVLGPRIAPSEREDFLSLVDNFNPMADGLPLRQQIRDQLPDLPHHLCHAGFAVSYAGYNTTMETLMSGVPGVLVPKFKMLADDTIQFDQEQWGRLLRLQAGGMMTPAHPEDTQNPALFGRILDDAYAKGSPEMPLDMNGAANTAELVARLVMAKNGVRILSQPAEDMMVSIPAQLPAANDMGLRQA